MTDPALGGFDHVVGMDSLIHYRAPDMADAVARLAALATQLAWLLVAQSGGALKKRLGVVGGAAILVPPRRRGFLP